MDLLFCLERIYIRFSAFIQLTELYAFSCVYLRVDCQSRRWHTNTSLSIQSIADAILVIREVPVTR